MKKLKKLSINPEKVMKSEELINLRGGYGNGYEEGDYCCDATHPTSNEMREFCDSNTQLVQSWANVWSGFGYNVVCGFGYFG